jgi:hypothetical protein
MPYHDTVILLLFHMWRIVGALVCGAATIGFVFAASKSAGLINGDADWEAMPATAVIAAFGYLCWFLGNAGVQRHRRRGKMP